MKKLLFLILAMMVFALPLLAKGSKVKYYDIHLE